MIYLRALIRFIQLRYKQRNCPYAIRKIQFKSCILAEQYRLEAIKLMKEIRGKNESNQDLS